MADTPYTETEALLLALDDSAADSGNTDALDAYLRTEFLPNELLKLARGADLLSDRAGEILREKRKESRERVT